MWFVRDLMSEADDIEFSTEDEANAYIRQNKLSYGRYAIIWILDTVIQR